MRRVLVRSPLVRIDCGDRFLLIHRMYGDMLDVTPRPKPCEPVVLSTHVLARDAHREAALVGGWVG